MSDTNPVPGVSEANVAAEPPIETNEAAAGPTEAEQQAAEAQAERDAQDPRAAAERRAVERVRALREKQAPVTPPPAAESQETEQQAAERVRDAQGRFAPKSPPQQAEDEPRYKVKVLGVEKELPLSEILRGYSTNEAATQRFQEAARLREEAAALRAQQQAQPAQTQDAASSAGEEVFDPMVRVRTADGGVYERPYSDVMAYGTPEEIRQATTQMRALMAQPATPSITPDQIQAIVRYQTVRDREVQTLQQFLGENSAIVSDPDLATVAAAKVTRLMMEDLANLVPEYGPQIAAMPPQVIADRHAQARFMGLPVRPVGEIFAASAKETAERFGGRPTNGPANAFAEKAEAKRAAPQPVSGANARQAPTTDQPRRKTTSEIIQAERVARGFA
jgi:hypothetical protein